MFNLVSVSSFSKSSVQMLQADVEPVRSLTWGGADERRAKEMGVTGWVRSQMDGSVEVLAFDRLATL
jgi:hypothetical protein